LECALVFHQILCEREKEREREREREGRGGGEKKARERYNALAHGQAMFCYLLV
jgi:hypothetical protein